jgi:hypothetical protein
LKPRQNFILLLTLKLNLIDRSLTGYPERGRGMIKGEFKNTEMILHERRKKKPRDGRKHHLQEKPNLYKILKESDYVRPQGTSKLFEQLAHF